MTNIWLVSWLLFSSYTNKIYYKNMYSNIISINNINEIYKKKFCLKLDRESFALFNISCASLWPRKRKDFFYFFKKFF